MSEEGAGGIENIRVASFKNPMAVVPDTKAGAVTDEQLDSSKWLELHQRLLGIYTHELDRQYDNRYERAIDDDFYDNIQWEESEAEEVRDRGQEPLVLNVLAPSVNWVLGTEMRSRSDYKILPRKKDGNKAAQNKTSLMKYLADVNRTPFHESRAFADAVKSGLGWMEDGVRDDLEGEPVFSRYEDWRNILHDSVGAEMDNEDGRYIFRSKWLDLDIATSMFEERRRMLIESSRDAQPSPGSSVLDQYGDEFMDSREEDLLQFAAARAGDAFNGRYRQRVRMIEAWLKMPATVTRIRGGTFHGELYDPFSPGHYDEVTRGEGTLVSKKALQMFVAVFTIAGLCYFGPSPYRHNRFPFTPYWGYRRGRDGMPYGMIRGLRDLQRDINKRASKALYILSHSKIVMDKGAVDDIEDLRREASRPDAIIVKNQGKALILDVDRDLADAHLDMQSRNIAMVERAGGITNENLGQNTNARSGIAIQRRQDQGALTTTILFDHLRFAKQVRGEKVLSLMSQFVTEEKSFRITNQRGNPEYVTVNARNDAETDITRTKEDFIISEADWHASVRQAMVSELAEVITKLDPQIAVQLLDLLVEMMDIPNRDEIVKRIRAITGQRDPDADPANMSPEELAREEQKQMDAALDQKMKEATVAEQVAKAEKLMAEVTKILEDITSAKVGTTNVALDAAGKAIAQPAAAHVADHILGEAGFEGAGGGPGIGIPPEAVPAAPPSPPPPTPQAMPPQPMPPAGI